ncbi:alpha-1,4-glucan--maltose-1-phosphate maltosyltransferase [Novosphingobium aquimarinum]|uniref:alpha-1,4-glucan--maltose-1-phosphate maltosyltransferase n=1 Tax=Novosphingobium aquimarinum TaxID=2682494 RepID=UPI0018DC3219|nr:alpha-1,4-glucan--maltose-1-phosphate maltosyltransferase [Novosphingobium aquimarinum]
MLSPEPEAKAVRAVSIEQETGQLGETLAAQLPIAAQAGFDALLWKQKGSPFARERLVPDFVITQAGDAGLAVWTEVDVTHFPIDHALVEAHPALFAIRHMGSGDAPIDPRRTKRATGLARARMRQKEAGVLVEAIAKALIPSLKDVSGLRLLGVDRLRPELLTQLLQLLREARADIQLFADIANMQREDAVALGRSGLDFLVSSYAWWDYRAAWFAEETEALRGTVPIVAETGAGQIRGDNPAAIGRSMMAAAALSDGMIAPLGAIRAAPEAAKRASEISALGARHGGEMRRLTGSGSPVVAWLRAKGGDLRTAQSAHLVLINTAEDTQDAPSREVLLPGLGGRFAMPENAFASLTGCEVRSCVLESAAPILDSADWDVAAGAREPRLVVEEVNPRVEGGAFPVKRVVGDTVSVTAKVFADGHEQLAAEIEWRAVDGEAWNRVRMAQHPNDDWTGAFPLERMGRHEFRVTAWLDRFGGFQRDFRKKLAAGVAQKVDHAEGRRLVERAAQRSDKPLREKLESWAKRLASDTDSEALLSIELGDLMDQADDRPHLLSSPVQLVDAERLQAGFSSWYELFPRSETRDPARHGTFRDVIERLPAIQAMGFDTLYFPPIHPIGRANRKGPNNSLEAGETDPGSPYAIGSKDGGHTAIHPELGSFEDFKALIDAAHEHALEIALDFAIQCSPDHPWLKEHPDWFDWRPDGSIKYAENPPKKYQDIVNVDFYQDGAIPGLWLALRDAVLFWIDHGVKTFRVDNPHTKPLPFWEWMIGDVRAKHPDAIFLAEAFTRPAMMYRLAKIGFSQSYTYFTWRDHKAELTDYIVGLTQTAPREFYRPHFFVNTPDINPPFLQTSGRPGFRIRTALAATLSGLMGVYSGFELCEAAPVPGKEEYLDSEKYQIRVRDWDQPGNIVADITLFNRLRRSHPALQTHLNTRFLTAHNEAILYYAKPSPDGSDIILVMVSLDPHHAQSAGFEIPLWEFGIGDDGSIGVEDLASGGKFRWWGKWQHIGLDPSEPYRIWRIAPGADA